ncbi:MAG: outer membrane protein assembly factor BamA [Gammaproteobacteria bacterium]|nr:outer membrane protein assembly factor BamA [Gammaproteobacteria bacterium]
MTIKIIKIITLSVLLLVVSSAIAEPFKIRDIIIEGLERIEPGTVFTYIPVKVGDVFTDTDSAEIIRELYKTELFSDVVIRLEDFVLIVEIKERPGIASLDIIGNKDIPDEQLIESLTDIGIAPGRVLNRSVLERLENELLQQYFARGKYNVQIKTLTTELSRNRVDVQIQIAEGKAAKIKNINIVGNTIYEDKKLKKEFVSGNKAFWKIWSSSEKYSKQNLSADLETLRSEYLNTGYLNFTVDSTQVSITPDKKDIFITINVNEGDQYTLSEVKLAGNFEIPEQELRDLLVIEAGEIFSRGKVVASSERISNRLGSDGYAFARVNPIPEVDEESKTVSLTFFIDPGKRVYVRRVNITGNQYSRDEVFRRELRQMEGGWYTLRGIESSRRRIQRLAFVENVEFDTVQIPGEDDFVDINIKVTERLAGSFSIGAGISDSQGAVVTTSVSQDNFLGTGKQVSFQINTSSVNTVYDISYSDPFYTIDGVSRGFGFSYISTDAEEADISDFDSDQFSLRANYGIPLTEVDRVGVIGEIRTTEISTNDSTSDEVNEFLNDNGDDYITFNLSGLYTHDSRNRRIFGTKGLYHRTRFEFTVPSSDLEYYKGSHENIWLFPLNEIFTLSTRSEIGYGDSFGSTTDLPFFEKFRAGGTGSVRGYRDNTLGPQDSRDDAFGGNFLTTAGVEIFFPIPALYDASRFRLGIFADMGNVFEDYDDFETSELRGSAGLGVNLITGLGGITLSFSSPFNDDEDDETEPFQFEFGTSF